MTDRRRASLYFDEKWIAVDNTAVDSVTLFVKYFEPK